jgi:hypothetical protein
MAKNGERLRRFVHVNTQHLSDCSPRWIVQASEPVLSTKWWGAVQWCNATLMSHICALGHSKEACVGAWVRGCMGGCMRGWVGGWVRACEQVKEEKKKQARTQM